MGDIQSGHGNSDPHCILNEPEIISSSVESNSKVYRIKINDNHDTDTSKKEAAAEV